MKCERVNEAGVDFKPVVLTLTLESLDELKNLWCRLNLNQSDVKKLNVDSPEYNDFALAAESYPLFDLVDDICAEHGLPR